MAGGVTELPTGPQPQAPALAPIPDWPLDSSLPTVCYRSLPSVLGHQQKQVRKAEQRLFSQMMGTVASLKAPSSNLDKTLKLLPQSLLGVQKSPCLLRTGPRCPRPQ